MNSLLNELHRLLIWNCFLGGVLFNSVVSAEEPQGTAAVSRQYDQGIIFYNGEYISGSYQIRLTDNSVFINDLELPNSITVAETPTVDSHVNFFDEALGLQQVNQTVEIPAESDVQKLARYLVRALTNSDVIVLFDDEHFYALGSASQKYEFYKTLLKPFPKTTELSFLLGPDLKEETRAKWKKWVCSYTPPASLITQMRNFIEVTEEMESEIRSKRAAAQRLELLSYPLTLVGMFISVIAFGQLLQWIGKGFAEQEERKPESERYLVMALLLMLGMSLVDLAWTILAGQAGIMREVNPVAAMYMDSPQKLAIFKVVATLIGLSILYFWRHKPVMQQATWWMCLVCVLVTFRWVVFNSMMS